MPIGGLPAPATGSVALSSVSSVLVCTAGLALLSGTRPSDVGGRAFPVYMKIVFGVFGALIYFVGLVLNSIPMLMGVSTDQEGKAAAIVHCQLVLSCWLAERYLLEAGPLRTSRSWACALVWFGSVLVAWAGPRPHDNISQGLDSQIAGCDGGYRSPFLIYGAMWITSLAYGTLLVGTLLLKCKEGCGSEAHDIHDVESSFALRRGSISALQASALLRGALPIVYGFATSMSGLVFAFGAARNEMMWVLLGALLLVLAVLCAWISLWRLDLPLESWALLSQGFSTLLCLGQEHLVFRDFRWDPDNEYGLLVIWKRPGLEIYLTGLLVLVATLLLFVASAEQDGQTAGGREDLDLDAGVNALYSKDAKIKKRSAWPTWQWILMPVCFVSMVFGLTRPLVQTQVVWPRVGWVNGEEAVREFQEEPGSGEVHGLTSERSYIDMIGEFYDKRLPCSALFVATNSAIYPPLQFVGLLTVLSRPMFVPQGVINTIREELMKRALFRFTNPMYLMLFVSFLNLPEADTDLSKALQFQASFEWGFWCLVLYCITSHILAQSLSSIDASGRGVKDLSSRELLSDNEDNDSHDGDRDQGHSAIISIVGAIGLVAFISVAMYIGLTRPVLGFTYRVSGIKVGLLEPTLLDLWVSLSHSQPTLAVLAAFMFVFAMLVWVGLIGVMVLSRERGWPLGLAERCFRPWVMGHVWALAIVVVYYISRSRSKAIIEYCVHFPDPHIGVFAVVAMGMGVYLLLKQSQGVVRPPAHSQRHTSDGVLSQLPGGYFVWVIGPVVTGGALVVGLDRYKPTPTPEITSLQDVNKALSIYLPNANDRLQRWMPESAGDCQALWQYRTVHGMPTNSIGSSSHHRQCVGSSPLVSVHQASAGRSVTASALWVTGLNTLEVTDMRVLPPSPSASSSPRWNMTVSGIFTNVHVWMKVDVGGKEWVNDYLCCDNPFHFVLQATTECRDDVGFAPIQLSLLNSDEIKFVHNMEFSSHDDSGSTSSSLVWDYGQQDIVEKELSKVITGEKGKLLVKTTSGDTLDALKSVSDLLTSVMKLNSRQLCPHQY